MFDHTHYVPVLRWKQGEILALKDLSTSLKAGLTPLIEIAPVAWDFAADSPAKSVAEHLEKTPRQFEEAWGTELPIFVDGKLLPEGEQVNGVEPIEWLFAELRHRALASFPVIGLSRSATYSAAIKRIVQADKRGVCLRLELIDFDDEELEKSIDSLLDELRLSPEETDLIVDLGDVGMQQGILRLTRSCLSTLPNIHRWRSFTVLGGSFPVDLSGIGVGVSHIERVEWSLWRKLIGKPNFVPRLPTFGDYAISNPSLRELDPRLISPTANIRYTVDDEWLVFKGRNVRKGRGFAQFHDLSQNVVNHPGYCGAVFSRGDGMIEECANRQTGPGNLTTWRQIGTNHHLTFILKRLSTMFGSSGSVAPQRRAAQP